MQRPVIQQIRERITRTWKIHGFLPSKNHRTSIVTDNVSRHRVRSDSFL